MHRYAKLQLFIIFYNYLATFYRTRTLRMRTTDFALRKATTGEYTATTYKQKGKEKQQELSSFTFRVFVKVKERCKFALLKRKSTENKRALL